MLKIIRWPSALSLVLCFSLSGCMTLPGSVSLQPTGAAFRSVAGHAALRASDRSHVDPVPPSSASLPTGELFAREFAMPVRPSSPILQIISSNLDRSLTDVGFTVRWTYSVTALLTYDGHKEILHAKGIDDQHGFLPAAAYAQGACEAAVVNLAKQVNALTQS